MSLAIKKIRSKISLDRKTPQSIYNVICESFLTLAENRAMTRGKTLGSPVGGGRKIHGMKKGVTAQNLADRHALHTDDKESRMKQDVGQDLQGAVMVVGGGIAGMQAALDLADSGFYVHLVEKSSAIGGVMSQLDKTFPTNDCAM